MSTVPFRARLPSLFLPYRSARKKRTIGGYSDHGGYGVYHNFRRFVRWRHAVMDECYMGCDFYDVVM